MAPASGPQLVIGLTGPNAAGKGELAAHLVRCGFEFHSLSDVLREEAARRGLTPTREHLIRTGTLLRRENGSAVLAERIMPRLRGRSVVDSIRNPAEAAALRRLPRFRLLGVRAPIEVRFWRALSRARPGDPRTLAEFRQRELEENTADPAAQQLDATFLLADHVIENDRDLADLERKMDELLLVLDPPGSLSVR